MHSIMNHDKFNKSKYSNDVLIRQEKLLEKTQRIKIAANILEHQEKTLKRDMAPKQKTTPVPRTNSVRRFDHMIIVSASHKSETDRVRPISNLMHQNEPPPKEFKTRIVLKPSKLLKQTLQHQERSKSFDSYQDDILDSLVRYDGDSENTEAFNPYPVLDPRKHLSDNP